jgi:hypothetical protein
MSATTIEAPVPVDLPAPEVAMAAPALAEHMTTVHEQQTHDGVATLARIGLEHMGSVSMESPHTGEKMSLARMIGKCSPFRTMVEVFAQTNGTEAAQKMVHTYVAQQATKTPTPKLNEGAPKTPKAASESKNPDKVRQRKTEDSSPAPDILSEHQTAPYEQTKPPLATSSDKPVAAAAAPELTADNLSEVPLPERPTEDRVRDDPTPIIATLLPPKSAKFEPNENVDLPNNQRTEPTTIETTVPASVSAPEPPTQPAPHPSAIPQLPETPMSPSEPIPETLPRVNPSTWEQPEPMPPESDGAADALASEPYLHVSIPIAETEPSIPENIYTQSFDYAPSDDDALPLPEQAPPIALDQADEPINLDPEIDAFLQELGLTTPRVADPTESTPFSQAEHTTVPQPDIPPLSLPALPELTLPAIPIIGELQEQQQPKRIALSLVDLQEQIVERLDTLTSQPPETAAPVIEAVSQAITIMQESSIVPPEATVEQIAEAEKALLDACCTLLDLLGVTYTDETAKQFSRFVMSTKSGWQPSSETSATHTLDRGTHEQTNMLHVLQHIMKFIQDRLERCREFLGSSAVWLSAPGFLPAVA